MFIPNIPSCHFGKRNPYGSANKLAYQASLAASPWVTPRDGQNLAVGDTACAPGPEISGTKKERVKDCISGAPANRQERAKGMYIYIYIYYDIF